MAKEQIACEEFCVHPGILAHFTEKQLSEEDSQRLAALFKALGDGTRVKILYYLTQEPMCVCDLSVLVGISQSALSHQLRVLRNMQIVQGRKDGKQVFYSVCNDHISSLLLGGISYIRQK